MRRKILIVSYLILALSILEGCSDDDSAKDSYSNNVANNAYNNTANGGNVNVGGVQDIGVFREIIESGGIPAPSTFSDNGFFSEHYIEYPFSDCGENICLNGMMGRGNSVISNDYMNVIQIVLKSYLDPADFSRPPTDFILVIDVSGSMAGDKITKVREGLHLMVDSLNSDDRISLIAFSDFIQEKLDLTYADSLENKESMHLAVSNLVPGGSTNIYGGLSAGFAKAQIGVEQERHVRVVLLSDGVPTSGEVDPNVIQSFAESRATDNVQLTSIGVGSDINYDLMKNLALEGGNFYYIENYSALSDIFVTELDYFAFPIAKDITISVVSSTGIKIGDSVGFGDAWIPEGNGGSAQFPNLYLASRTSNDIEDPYSRRGGGSALFLRVTPTGETVDLSKAYVKLRYLDPDMDDYVDQLFTLSDLGMDGSIPVDEYYSEYEMKKSFAMLNAYLAFYETVVLAENWMMEESFDLITGAIDWMYTVNIVLDDDDISADIVLMEQLSNNIYPYTYSGDDYYCNNGDCYYPETDYENDREEVHYGCSQGNGNSSHFISIMLLTLSFALYFRRKYSFKKVKDL
ncbi:MAG: VWA domain-containing protein [Deltaproteobacteria bacterium]|nr:VWA domain-containing protein [Deltaproteobacteria bacterium]